MTELVPPRSGLKKKSKVLSHFNRGCLFQLVEVFDKGKKHFGILDEEKSRGGKYFVWIDTELKSKEFDYNSIRALDIPNPPKVAIEPFVATIGGIGKHLRWKVVMAKKVYKGDCKIFVSHILDKERFKSFVDTNIKPFGFCSFEFKYFDNVCTTVIDIPNHRDLTMVAAALHCAQYNAVPLDDEMASYGNLGIERYDRSEHTWWNQEQANAGPLRDTHKWKYGFIPKEWKKLPFTWKALASNINVNVDEIGSIPYPLRNYVCDHLEKTCTEDERLILDENRTKYRCVTSRLTAAQNVQILKSTYWTFVAPFDKNIVKLSSLLQFRYMLHGYLGRELGGYRQTAQYIGHGAYCRNFKAMPQYKYENLNNEVKNKLSVVNGQLLGNGFKGTRGKYGNKNFPKYKPNKKMKRSVEAEINIRESPYNQFEQYEITKKQRRENQSF